VRFTTRGDALYIIALGLPDGQLAIKTLGLKAGNGKIAGVKVLGGGDVAWKQKDEELLIQPSKNYPSEYAVSYVVTFVH